MTALSIAEVDQPSAIRPLAVVPLRRVDDPGPRVSHPAQPVGYPSPRVGGPARRAGGPVLGEVASAQPECGPRGRISTEALRPSREALRPSSGAVRPSSGAVRLTRRGRAVAACLVIMAAVVVACLFSLRAADGALALNHGPARAGYQGMRRMVVEPGQTLWSIAATAEPSADPRQVIQQIMQANAITGSVVYAGETLWVPRH